MEQPQVRINPQTGQPEVAVYQPLDEASLQQEVNDAQVRFDTAEQEVEQLNQVVQNTRTALEQSEAELRTKVEEKDAADLALQAAKSKQDALARAREVFANQPQPGESEGAGEDAGEPAGDSDPTDISDRINVAA